MLKVNVKKIQICIGNHYFRLEYSNRQFDTDTANQNSPDNKCENFL